MPSVVIICLQDYEHEYRSIPEYITYISVDSTRHHAFMRSLQKTLQKFWDDPEKHKLKDANAKTRSSTESVHTVGRNLVACWSQAVPMDKFGLHYPNTQPDKTGFEFIGGKKVSVAYVPKALSGFAKADHYDVQDVESNVLADHKLVTELGSDGDTEDEEVYNAKARKAKSLVWEKQAQALCFTTFNFSVLTV